MMIFEIYRSRQNRQHYVAIVQGDARLSAENIRLSRNLEKLTLVPDDGVPRIAFDPREAKSRIERKGFYSFAVTIEIREGTD